MRWNVKLKQPNMNCTLPFQAEESAGVILAGVGVGIGTCHK
uniref:Uncharacterized protein n=1 Tax=Anguilla anguilla TaxID=7936 RepID=A0A0E9SS88_ANGAN